MNALRPLLAPLAAAALVLHAPAQDLGSRVEALEVQGLAQTDAESFADFAGRTVLIEFFAYW
jgi:hypothetical protein